MNLKNLLICLIVICLLLSGCSMHKFSNDEIIEKTYNQLSQSWKDDIVDWQSAVILEQDYSADRMSHSIIAFNAQKIIKLEQRVHRLEFRTKSVALLGNLVLYIDPVTLTIIGFDGRE